MVVEETAGILVVGTASYVRGTSNAATPLDRHRTEENKHGRLTGFLTAHAALRDVGRRGERRRHGDVQVVVARRCMWLGTSACTLHALERTATACAIRSAWMPRGDAK
uniref:Uncharacterized protein n=1 Tax=Oryza sativa subsp. japonica TaxID=39947 RepID=Q6H6X0_ORYSJ|nr:hypothetical protein [Oryza sativa Japonica Group]